MRVLKYISITATLLIGIYTLLSTVSYPSKIKYIKPISLSLLNNYNAALGDKEYRLLTKDETVALFIKSGCKDVINARCDTVKPNPIGSRKSYYNSWFNAECVTREDKKLKVSLTSHETALPDFRIDYKHSYCFDVMNERVECYTQHLTVIPSR